MSHIQCEVKAGVGYITLNRPQALNALSLDMIRDITQALLDWRDDEAVQAVALRGMSKAGEFGAFCAGGDIRFFHAAALAGDPRLEDFFTEEYRLNHLIHSYPKPSLAFMDGIIMGGGMGLAQGCTVRIATERTRMAMPETLIGLFPDVGGGYFLSRCPGHLGEYLGLSGQHLDGPQAIEAGLADVVVPSDQLPRWWAEWLPSVATHTTPLQLREAAQREAARTVVTGEGPLAHRTEIDAVFGAPSLGEAMQALAQHEAQGSAWAQTTREALAKRSPLMLSVTWQQIRRARSLSVGQALRMERDLVRHCFHPMHLSCTTAQSDTVEGIRALAVDKDHQPRWRHGDLAEVTADQVQGFFESPWPPSAHPLADLKD
jgi:enoyl-CoA hydratase/carnithine racemase